MIDDNTNNQVVRGPSGDMTAQESDNNEDGLVPPSRTMLLTPYTDCTHYVDSIHQT